MKETDSSRSAVVGLRTAGWWPDVASALAAALVFILCRGGLFPPTVLGVAGVGVLAGLLAGACATSVPRAAALSAAPLFAGLMLVPVYGTGGVAMALIGAAAAGVTALLAKFALGREYIRSSMIVLIAVAIALAAFWYSTATLARDQIGIGSQTLFQFLDNRPQAGTAMTDQQFYNDVIYRIRDGESFYPAFRAAFHDNAAWAADPPSVMAVREPALLTLLARLPGGSRGPLWAMTLMASLAAAASVLLPRNLAGSPLKAVSAVAVVAYGLFLTTSPQVIGFEAWAGSLGLLSAVCFAASFDAQDGSRRMTALTICAAVLAVAAFAVRELMLFVPVAGLAAALFASAGRRRIGLLSWGAALVACLVIWGVHAAAVQPFITPSDVGGFGMQFGGLANVIAAVGYGAFYVTADQVGILALTALGIAGAALQRDRSYRVFVLVYILLPLAAFFAVWNRAIDQPSGHIINYWGAVVGPVIFAMIPAVLGAIPGVSSLSQSDTRDAGADAGAGRNAEAAPKAG